MRSVVFIGEIVYNKNIIKIFLQVGDD